MSGKGARGCTSCGAAPFSRCKDDCARYHTRMQAEAWANIEAVNPRVESPIMPPRLSGNQCSTCGGNIYRDFDARAWHCGCPDRVWVIDEGILFYKLGDGVLKAAEPSMFVAPSMTATEVLEQRETVLYDSAANPKDALGMKKPPLRLVPSALLLEVSRVMALGAKKYGAYNWRTKKVLRTIYLEAAMRHILSVLDGEDVDPESGRPHEAHAAACMGIILDAKALDTLIDDRPTKGAAAKLIKDLTEA